MPKPDYESIKTLIDAVRVDLDKNVGITNKSVVTRLRVSLGSLKPSSRRKLIRALRMIEQLNSAVLDVRESLNELVASIEMDRKREEVLKKDAEG